MIDASAASAVAYRLGWKVLCRIPQPLVDPALDLVADRLSRRGGRGVGRLRSNLARAAGTTDPDVLDRLQREAMRSYLRYWGEVFRLPRLSPDQIRAKVVTQNDERLREAYASGRGVVAALPHMGNWDLAGAWACVEDMPLLTVAERLQPESLYEDFLAFRRRLGMQVIPLTGGASPMPALVEHVTAGGFVCLLSDRDLSRSGLEVDLLGEPARMPRGPALLAQTTGATLLPVTTSFVGDQLSIRFFEPVEHRPEEAGLQQMTADIASAFGRAIADAPADWHMLQTVFTADLEVRDAR